MIKNGVMLGLYNAKYDIDKATPGNVLGSMLFYNTNDYGRAYFNAASLLHLMKLKKDELPISKNELEKYVSVKIAEMSFQDAILLLNNILSDRTNEQLIKECEDALKEIEENGVNYSTHYDTYKRQFEKHNEGK